ncbi:MAG: DUF456 domain-containing protein [Bacteroidetes bacterium]|nr:DUF456 domain-containing protein [Bacteroidota bacterium]MDA0937216.1 DUF456 domain-containing protein [Bacteroidota bacterium]MDA1345353.1 DUF456 domain-containing protein [Bacteroidota bacterium]
MEILLFSVSFLFILLGLAGSFLPILPGPLTSWIGLFLLHKTEAIEENSSFLVLTFVIALGIFVLDYIIPILGTKKFGGSKKGMLGATIGVLIGLLFLGPFGVLIGPFVGAYIGELVQDPQNKKTALRTALGSVIGFLTGVFLKFTVALVYMGLYLNIVWKNSTALL